MPAQEIVHDDARLDQIIDRAEIIRDTAIG
jgi:hypothetical protein